MPHLGTRAGRRRALLAAGSACALAVTGCSAAAGSTTAGDVVEVHGAQTGGLNGTEIGDVVPRPSLSLRDTTGAVFDLRSRPRGELTLLFFGYTHCREICPTTMADLAAARRALPSAQRAHVQVAFVTEDPRIDTPSVLRRWLDQFDHGFVGLIGGNPTTAATLKALKAPPTEHVTAAQSPAASPTETVAHGASVYAFVRGRVVVYTGGTTPREYAADFRELLSR